MTPEQRVQFDEMSKQLTSMSEQIVDLKAMIGKFDTFFFEEYIIGQPTRAASIDRGLTAFRGYKFSSKLTMLAIGFLLTVGSGVAAYDAVISKIKDSAP